MQQVTDFLSSLTTPGQTPGPTRRREPTFKSLSSDLHACCGVHMHAHPHRYTHTFIIGKCDFLKDEFQPRIPSDVQAILQALKYLCQIFDSQPFISEFILLISSVEICSICILTSWHDSKLCWYRQTLQEKGLTATPRMLTWCQQARSTALLRLL